ncbi:MAG: methyltransferase domain-containing protein, partial [archaeon]
NLGCGPDYKGGFINVDILDSVKVDKRCDLQKLPLPFKDSSVDYVYMRYVLMYIRDVYPWLKELHRICKGGATIRFIEPHFSCTSLHTDLERVRGFTTDSFKNDMYHFNVGQRFKLVRQRIAFPKIKFFMSWFANRFPGFYEHNLAYIFQARDVEFVLKVVK